MTRTNISSGGPWEATVGYSRAVRVGNAIYVSGCSAMKDGQLTGEGDAYAQACQALENIASALSLAGASMRDVVRTRMFLAAISDWPGIARAHAEVFGDIRPASTLVAVSGLIDPRMLVEIEADAVVGDV